MTDPASGPSLQIVFDALRPQELAGFWATALGYIEQPPPPGFDDWPSFLATIGVPEDVRTSDAAFAIIDPAGARPRIFFQRVPEGKTAKNRVHLDVNVGAGLAAEERKPAVLARAAELEALGAHRLRVVDEPAGWCVVMQDPEGNEFCLQ